MISKLLTKPDLIRNILEKTDHLGISKLLYQFIVLGTNKNDYLFSLYFCIANLASPMLATIPKEITTSAELYKALKQVLYVSGEWEALSDFYFITNFPYQMRDPFTATTVCKTDTNFIRKYVQNNRTVTITLSDSLYAVVCDVSTLHIERMTYNDSITTY